MVLKRNLQVFQLIILLLQLTEVFMQTEMVDKNATLMQRIERRLNTKHCMPAEMSPQDNQNSLLLAKLHQGYALSLLFTTTKI